MVRARLVTAGLFLVAACMVPPQRRAPVPQPGFTCTAGSTDGAGAWASVTLDAAGRQLRAEWNWRRFVLDSRLQVGAAGMVNGSTPLDPAHGIASLAYRSARVRRAPAGPG